MPKPVRVLHIVGAMNYGGVETWLMGLLRQADRAEIAMDFLVHTAKPAAHDAEIAALHGRIIPCPAIHRLAYLQDFDRALRRFGPYDVLHSHVHYFSGLTTTLARGRGVRLRIAHSHNDTTLPDSTAGPLRASYRRLMRGGIFSSATHLLACSAPAAGALFGTDWRRRPRAEVVHYGVDFAPFASADRAADRESARREFGIGPAEIVLGHVGRFDVQKNHVFLASIAAEALDREAGLCVLCVGVGPLSEEVRARFEKAGVRAIFAGARRDIPRLLRAMDVFVFPSLHEGLPLAVLEAQAAGLPCVISTEITREVEAVRGLIRWLPLSAGAGAWADTALDAARQPAKAFRGLRSMRSSPFSVETSFTQMCSIYRS